MPASPGEFTKRAFLNGKTDLAKLEGLADLLEAETSGSGSGSWRSSSALALACPCRSLAGNLAQGHGFARKQPLILPMRMMFPAM